MLQPSVKWSAGFFATLLWGGTLYAQPGFRNQSVSIFKNATAFMVKSGTVQMDDKHWLWQSDSIPQFLEGTFWASAPDNDLLVVKSLTESKKQTAVVQSLTDILNANDGKRVRLYFNTGILLGSVQDSLQREGTLYIPKHNGQASGLYALRTAKNGLIFFAPTEIAALRRIEFLDDPNVIREYSTNLPTLRFEFKNSRPNQQLGFMYLQKGISWNPEYKIELRSDDKAHLQMWATVINDAEDFNADEMNLVAGVPNFNNANEAHRLVRQLLSTRIASTLTTTGSSGGGYLSSEYSNSSTYSNFSRFSNEAYTNSTALDTYQPLTTTTNNEDLTTASVGDMYYYTLKNVALRRGERAIFDVFEAEIPIQHIYRTEVPTNPDNYLENYVIAQASHIVKHSLGLKNTSPYAWTAGSALITSNTDGKTVPVCQDALYFTAPQQPREIYLSQPSDVVVRSSDVQKDRQKNHKKITRESYDFYYDLITVNAEIEIQNYKNTPINIEVKRTVIGELLDSSDKWEASRPVTESTRLNATNFVKWMLPVAAGEKKKVQYAYKIYVERWRTASGK